MKAEEVFAFACENIEPQTRGNVAEGARSFHETCIERTRQMQLHDLTSITTMVAEGMRDRTRSQQNFPASDLAQFHIEGGYQLAKEPHREMAFIEPSLEEQLREQEGTAPLSEADAAKGHRSTTAFVEPSLEEQLRDQEDTLSLSQAIPESSLKEQSREVQNARAIQSEHEHQYDEPGMDY